MDPYPLLSIFNLSLPFPSSAPCPLQAPSARAPPARAPSACASFPSPPHAQTCPICLCERTDAVLQCGHAFHWDCVHVWLDAHNTCPVCRTHQRRLKEPLLL